MLTKNITPSLGVFYPDDEVVSGLIETSATGVKWRPVLFSTIEIAARNLVQHDALVTIDLGEETKQMVKDAKRINVPLGIISTQSVHQAKLRLNNISSNIIIPSIPRSEIGPHIAEWLSRLREQ
jgi:hypothetical protein